MMFGAAVGVVGVVVVAWVEGHGRLVDPPARSSMWRLGFDTPVHYNDHQLFCGGYSRQWVENRGRCGECGDPWDLPRPRPNEAGGTWGTGTISRVYREGQVMTATVHLTANHMGWFEFRLCPNNEPRQYVKQKCLNKHVLSLVDHPGTRYHLKHSRTGLFRIRLQLPAGVTCSQCVVQWHYTTGNNWGFCKDGRNQPGCGPQEVFRGCSDVAIYPHDDNTYYQFLNLTADADLSPFLKLKDTINRTLDNLNGNLNLEKGGLVDPFDTSDDQDDFVGQVSKVDPTSQDDSVSQVDPQPQDKNDDFADIGDHFASDFPGGNDVGTANPGSEPVHQFLTFHHDPDPSSRPSITFVDDIKSKSLDSTDGHRSSGVQRPKPSFSPDDQDFRNPTYFSERQNSLPGASLKNYVSSDNFRRAIQFENDNLGSPISTPFIAASSNGINRPELVIKPYPLGVTPSPLDTPLVNRQPESRQSSSLLGEIQSDEPISDYTPVAEATERSVTRENTVPRAREIISFPQGQMLSPQDAVPGQHGVTPAAIQLLHSLPAAMHSAGSSVSPPLALQVPLSSLDNQESIERLLLLQRALAIAASSTLTKDPPIVLVLV